MLPSHTHTLACMQMHTHWLEHGQENVHIFSHMHSRGTVGKDASECTLILFLTDKDSAHYSG